MLLRKYQFLNPLEMALSSPAELINKVKGSTYKGLFEQVWGAGSLNGSETTVYNQIGQSIAAYERSSEVNPYSSKFDLFWDKAKARSMDVTKISTANWAQYRELGFSDNELYGLASFNDTGMANCASCHSLKPGSRLLAIPTPTASITSKIIMVFIVTLLTPLVVSFPTSIISDVLASETGSWGH